MLMKTTDITERGLELLIASDLTGIPPDQIANRSLLWDAAPAYGGSGYVLEILRIMIVTCLGSRKVA